MIAQNPSKMGSFRIFWLFFRLFILGKIIYFMNYSDFIDRLAETTGKSNSEAKELAENVFSVLTQELSRGHGVSVPNLGTFRVKVNDVKKVYNPHHEQYMLIPPKRVVEFTPASGLKDELKYSGRGNE